ncbi:Alpha/Beta hydrolase protein [Xylaria acuta]|nr:Alpha/Beta hydrolase protein [Xylaria acuta]
MAANGTALTLPSTSIRLPPYDPEITAVEDTQHRPIPTSFDELQALRREEPPQISVSGADGPLPAIVLKSKSKPATSKSRPGILFFHGGGRVMGNVYVGLAAVSEFVQELDAVIVSVGYRLSPDTPGIAAVKDCYMSLIWTSENLLLVCPMLDDWFISRYAWNCVLGEEAERGNVSYYLAPGRCHEFDLFLPTELGAEAVRARDAWLRALKEKKES